MASTSRQTVVNRDNARIAGIQKHCMSQSSILVSGVAYTPAQAIQIYQDDLNGNQAVASAKSALKAALAKASKARSAAATFDKAFKLCIEGAYAGEPAVLDDFGVVVGVPRTPSAKVKAAAADKAEATRTVRHIMGKNQRSEIVAPDTSDVAASVSPEPVSTGNGAAPAAQS